MFDMPKSFKVTHWLFFLKLKKWLSINPYSLLMRAFKIQMFTKLDSLTKNNDLSYF